ncbi:Cys-Gly metallodipeptidase dug1 [Neolecta irregularis DAH-3]|uniref:Cys-Gly metallodipeptidase dug1 n=1 Tax=Neolecta irregularis (strain DAH-3) TaxID=1198029 RepID=A0A1U7LT80_NEOID|nr:Cys-Gly metallodipeptidase dug1 [Neolecta irregularis DAH-3]|eukprot:OLL25854.1 Cys-Gly metallodipeptidase dug1 [Neolecta irregularis DAH-3]
MESGLRGVSYFEITVAGPGKDLHSGLFGGTLYEPMTDLVHLMGSLVQPNGTINIPGIMDQVAPLTMDEEKLYGNLSFTMQELYNALGSTTSIHENDKDTLMHKWRYPSLSLHGIEGAFSASGSKTVIPAKVKGKFSIRSVPDMDPEQVTKLVQNYLSSVFANLKSKNEFNVICLHGGKPWTTSVDHYNFVAASKAIEEVFGVKPDFTREGLLSLN